MCAAWPDRSKTLVWVNVKPRPSLPFKASEHNFRDLNGEIVGHYLSVDIFGTIQSAVETIEIAAESRRGVSSRVAAR